MGYCMSENECQFFMSHKGLDAALDALKKWVEEDRNAEEFHKKRLLGAKSLDDMLGELRWRVERNNKGDIEYIFFEGEKLWEDHEMFVAIAPYVKKGSYIEMSGEDGTLWRWVFDGETCHEVNAKVVWPRVKKPKPEVKK